MTNKFYRVQTLRLFARQSMMMGCQLVMDGYSAEGWHVHSIQFADSTAVILWEIEAVRAPKEIKAVKL